MAATGAGEGPGGDFGRAAGTVFSGPAGGYRLVFPVPVSLAKIIAHADALLRPDQFSDYPGAVNGLQMENRGTVTRLAAAVDSSAAVLQKVVASGADLLLVHHGMFWNTTVPWTGRRAEQLRLLVERNLAVYAMHLPLDAHPRLGNAAQLAQALGFRNLRPFFHDPKHPRQAVGWQTTLVRPVAREVLQQRLAKVLSRPVTLLAGGAPMCRRIGICTGGAGSQLALARQEGVDAFITGEGPHWSHALAEDLGLNAFYGGHYATETFGVKALAQELARKFKLPWEFVDHPSGL